MTTAKSPLENRWNDTLEIWKENAVLWIVPGLVLGIAIGFVIGVFSSRHIEGGFIEGIWPEVLSTGVAVALLYYLDKWRDQTRERNQLKKELLWQVRSRVTDVAISAIDRMRHEGWLEDGLLRKVDSSDAYSFYPKWNGANLRKANLQDVRLRIAELQNASLNGADLEYVDFSNSNCSNSSFVTAKLRASSFYNVDLSGSTLSRADMRSCRLDSANLQHATLSETRLENAHLRGVNATNADFRFANLYGANLGGANLTGACLYGADVRNAIWHAPFHGTVILPDGTPYESEKDLLRFTEPKTAWLPPWIKGRDLSQYTEVDRFRHSKLKKKRESMPIDQWLPDEARREKQNILQISDSLATKEEVARRATEIAAEIAEMEADKEADKAKIEGQKDLD